MAGQGTKRPFEVSHGPGGGGATGLDADTVLVSSSQKGDLAAFESLVMRHQKRMLNIAFRLISDYDEASEVVQDAFVAAYKNIKAFRGDAKFSTWLTSITVNLSKNRLKQMISRRGHLSYTLDDPLWTDDSELTRDQPSKEPSALDCLEKQDVRNRVQDCIKALDPDYREVLVLRDMQDFSYDDIGGMLSMKEGTVKSRLSRARTAIRDCLKKAVGEL
jgi:RNA polymerase sigma-70 factor (ECF subfamily)